MLHKSIKTDLDSINAALSVLRSDAYDGLYFSGAHVFPFPSKCVSNTILKIEIAQFVHGQYVAREKVRVASFEHVPNDFLSRGVGIRVTRQVTECVILPNSRDKHARFVWFITSDAKSIWASDGFSGHLL